MKQRVVVAMSGGVDSSLAAHLLKEQGYAVIGATMRLWNEQARSRLGSCETTGVADARSVAQELGIPHHVFNLEEEFEQEVIQYFCQEYRLGRTPNPCIVCNKKMKFGFLLRKALELGAFALATGHYARQGFDDETNRYVLKKGIDVRKDQSYVLFSLSQDQLRYTLFPLGGYLKDTVRKKARQLDLGIHDRPESQEICFIQESSYHSFLKGRLGEPAEPGPIVDRRGVVLGQHRGILYYTIGQRRGLGVAAGRPLYVTAIDRERNAIVVGTKEEVLARRFIVNGLNWIRPPDRSTPLSAQVKIRYNHPGSEACLSARGENELEVTFKTPQKAITPGQAAVFFDGDTVIGGGWIKEIVRSSE